MELRNIRSFVKVTELGSITSAAKELGYAQSTVTLQIRQLEEELNINLFNRNGKKLTLSDSGKDFLHYAYQIIKYETNAINHFTINNEPKGNLKIGIMETICYSDYSKLFQDFTLAHPTVSLTIQVATTHQALENLDKGNYDVIFLLDNKIQNPNMVTVREYPTDISFFCSSSHPLVNEKKVCLERLLHEPFILTEKGCNYRDVFETDLAARNLKLNCRTEIGYTKFIIDAVSNQLGISLLPSFSLQEALEEGEISLLKISDYQIQMYIQVIYSSKRPITPPLHAFLNSL
ncbi:MAG: LysR family transcriptional regulator [Lachnospiraceae bacterium]